MPCVLASSRRVHVRRLIRYGSVSAISTVTSLTILGLLVGVFDLSAIWANVMATAIGTIPSFELNRRWVWSQRDERSVFRQIVPYCALSFSGLIVSSIAVHLASDATSTSTRLVHTGAVELANFGAYGALWLIQFVLCDRILFKAPRESDFAMGPALVAVPPIDHLEDRRSHDSQELFGLDPVGHKSSGSSSPRTTSGPRGQRRT
jgi:putative flippase GtrA